jgi:transposase
MTRRQKDPLRPLIEEERNLLEQISHSQSEPASHVAHAKELLAVADGKSYTDAAKAAGRRSGDAVSQLVSRFNQEGIAAIEPRHGGGPQSIYGVAERERILAEARRQPDPERDGTATWSLTTLQQVLREAPDGLPKVSTYIIWTTLIEAGWTWQKDRTWCETGKVKRKREGKVVEVTDPDATAKKKLIEQAYLVGESLGLAVWTTDQAGPFQTQPYPGTSWEPEGHPRLQPHEYIRNGTAKLLTLFHPADGKVRVKGVLSCTNSVLHPWLKQKLTDILAALPEPAADLETEVNRALWERWFEGLSQHPTLPDELPPLRALLVMDNLAGHKSTDFVSWLFEQGIIPLYTPLGGSWLNMAESIQRILKRRGLEGQYPKTPDEIIQQLEAVARGWNRNPTPFVWGGKRAARRQRSRQRRYALGGSGACAKRPVRRRQTKLEKWLSASQVTH